jgi:hypothetical protein
MVRKVSVTFKREKGPPTPKFGKFSHMLNNKSLSKGMFDLGKADDQHGGVGIKMAFVCEVLETLQRIEQMENKNKIFSDGTTIYINQGVFYGTIFNLDIIVFELYSLLDYFAVELAQIFGLKVTRKGHLKDVEYFIELKDLEGLNSRIAQKVDSLIKQEWFDYFHRLRNRVTHRLPISLGSVVRKQDYKIASIEFPFLPDNPDEVMSDFKRRLDPANEAKKWLEGIFNFIDDVCGELIILFGKP